MAHQRPGYQELAEHILRIVSEYKSKGGGRMPVRQLFDELVSRNILEKDEKYTWYHRKLALILLAQLSQLGTEIGTFDSGRAVSFHHNADCSVDGYTPLAVAALAISRSACRTSIITMALSLSRTSRAVRPDA